jgi:hypothetical protein
MNLPSAALRMRQRWTSPGRIVSVGDTRPLIGYRICERGKNASVFVGSGIGAGTWNCSSSSMPWMTTTRSVAAATSGTSSIGPRTTIAPAIPPRICWATPPWRWGWYQNRPPVWSFGIAIS